MAPWRTKVNQHPSSRSSRERNPLKHIDLAGKHPPETPLSKSSRYRRAPGLPIRLNSLITKGLSDLARHSAQYISSQTWALELNVHTAYSRPWFSSYARVLASQSRRTQTRGFFFNREKGQVIASAVVGACPERERLFMEFKCSLDHDHKRPRNRCDSFARSSH
jgi:hypothetical protein